MYRFFDILLSLIGIILTFPFLIFISIIGFFDTGSPIFDQERVGKKMQPFTLLKFRTMTLDTKSIASHLAPSKNITKFGKLLRKTKLVDIDKDRYNDVHF